MLVASDNEWILSYRLSIIGDLIYHRDVVGKSRCVRGSGFTNDNALP